MSELKPCPFCGSMNIRKPIGEDGWMCKTCGSKGFVDWNTRPIEDALLARIAELEEFIGKLIEAGESEDSPMPAVWLELVNDWKEREG